MRDHGGGCSLEDLGPHLYPEWQPAGPADAGDGLEHSLVDAQLVREAHRDDLRAEQLALRDDGQVLVADSRCRSSVQHRVIIDIDS